MKWTKRTACTSCSDYVSKTTGLSEDEFFAPDYGFVPSITNLEKAANFILKDIQLKKKITIIGDYDADGVTSSAILCRLFRVFGIEVKTILPRRFTDGYGMNIHMVDSVESGLIITVDNGIAAIEPIAKAKAKGLDVIVLDHHPMNEDNKALPCADVIVDPSAIPGDEFSGYCGAGLAYRLAEILIPGGKYQAIKDKILDDLSALAAIGTVADSMDILSDNRRIVKKGLKAMNNGTNISGLSALIDVANVKVITSEKIGFTFGPMINACGRLLDDGPYLAFNLLTSTENYEELIPYAERLVELNNERKELTVIDLEEAERIIEDECLFSDTVLTVCGENFNEGIVGIIASRLVEKYGRPAIVCNKKVITNSDGKEISVYKGSGRSINGINLKSVLEKATDFMLGYGGHAAAAGVSIYADKLCNFKNIVCEQVDQSSVSKVVDELFYDFEVPFDCLEAFIKEQNLYAPYGKGIPMPVVKIADVTLLPRNGFSFACFGANDEHLRLFSKDISMMFFRQAEKYLKAKSAKVDVVGQLSFGEYDKFSLTGIDFKPSETEIKRSSLANSLLAHMKKL
ncbi:MAG: hypothetical protein GX903_11905 [Spirochaetales bacterium]|nr:hypothetical protein [Spirochaetales bacterium]